MNQFDEMQRRLEEVKQTINVTYNTLALANEGSSDYEEIIDECIGNIQEARVELGSVQLFLHPSEITTRH